jgi:hypothetical protein
MANIETPIQQKLYKHQALERLLCAPCNDAIHKHCEGYECTCLCRDARPPRVRVRRDKNGLSEQERSAQYGLPFADHAPLTVSSCKASGVSEAAARKSEPSADYLKRKAS